MAKKFVNKGDLVFSSKPFVFALFQSERDNRCDQCFKPLKANKIPCYKCLRVMFCGRKCQMESKAEDLHSLECSVLASRPLNCITRLVTRVINKLSDKENEHSETIWGHKRDWNCLMDHYDDIKRDPSAMYEFEHVHDQLSLIFGEALPDVPTVLSIYGKLLINSFAVQDQFMRQIGRAVYLGPSIFDHSCKPELNFLFIGTTIYIKAIKSAQIADVTDLRISYIDEFESTEERQRQLSSAFYFQCDCERCNSDEMSVVCMSENHILRPICEKIENFVQQNHYLMALVEGSGSLAQKRLHNSSAPLVSQLRQDVMPLRNVLEVKIAEFVAIHTRDMDLWRKVIDIYCSYYGACHQRLALKLFVLAVNCDKYPSVKRQLLLEAKTIANIITPDVRLEINCNTSRSRTINRSSDSPIEATLLYRIQSELIDRKYLSVRHSDIGLRPESLSRHSPRPLQTSLQTSLQSYYSQLSKPSPQTSLQTHYKQRSRSTFVDYKTRRIVSTPNFNHRFRYF